MYSFNSLVRFSELDENGLLSIPAAIRYFLDCSSLQSETLGRGIAFLRERRIAWWLFGWQIEFFRMPALGEEIRISTWAYGFSGIYAHRNFLMEDASGKTLLWADSSWFSMDMEKGCPRRPLPEEVDVYREDSEGRGRCLLKEAMEKRLLPSGVMERGETIVIGKEHLDSNRHVNNVRYIEFALDLLKLSDMPRTLDVRYKKSALLGDILSPEMYAENAQLFVEFKNQAGETCSVVRIRR